MAVKFSFELHGKMTDRDIENLWAKVVDTIFYEAEKIPADFGPWSIEKDNDG